MRRTLLRVILFALLVAVTSAWFGMETKNPKGKSKKELKQEEGPDFDPEKEIADNAAAQPNQPTRKDPRDVKMDALKRN